MRVFVVASLLLGAPAVLGDWSQKCFDIHNEIWQEYDYADAHSVVTKDFDGKVEFTRAYPKSKDLAAVRIFNVLKPEDGSPLPSVLMDDGLKYTLSTLNIIPMDAETSTSAFQLTFVNVRDKQPAEMVSFVVLVPSFSKNAPNVDSPLTNDLTNDLLTLANLPKDKVHTSPTFKWMEPLVKNAIPRRIPVDNPPEDIKYYMTECYYVPNNAIQPFFKDLPKAITA